MWCWERCREHLATVWIWPCAASVREEVVWSCWKSDRWTILNWVDALRRLGNAPEAEVAKMEGEWSVWVLHALEDCIQHWSAEYGVPELIGFSGHTWYHEPAGRGTAAIGDAEMLSQKLGIPVVADYRSADVEAGGQGAPLVPLFDAHVFQEYGCCINLGGIANATLLSPEPVQVRAWDVVGCNLLLNRQARRLGVDFDAGGSVASKVKWTSWPRRSWTNGRICSKHRPSRWQPKTLSELHRILEGVTHPPDALCTAVEWIAEVLGSSLELDERGGRILVTGGGAHNGIWCSASPTICRKGGAFMCRKRHGSMAKKRPPLLGWHGEQFMGSRLRSPR